MVQGCAVVGYTAPAAIAGGCARKLGQVPNSNTKTMRREVVRLDAAFPGMKRRRSHWHEQMCRSGAGEKWNFDSDERWRGLQVSGKSCHSSWCHVPVPMCHAWCNGKQCVHTVPTGAEMWVSRSNGNVDSVDLE